MADGYISQIKTPDNKVYLLKDSEKITSITIGATSPVQSSTSTAQTGSSASTTISLADAYGDTKNPYGSKTKNYVLAAPSNANGAPSFRALVATDIPNKIQTNWELNAASGNSPALLFTRDGTLTDWRIIVTSGKLSFQSATDAATWTERAYFKDNSGNLVVNSIEGNGSALTDLNGSNISSGTVAAARIDSAIARLVSPAFTGTPTAPTAANGTNTTQIATTAFVNNTLAYVDAMRFKGTLGTNGTVTDLPASHDAGDTYRVITAGTWAGKYCEVGTLIICVKDGTAAADADWTSVETNEDGAVIGPSSSTENQIAKFSSATGRTITNSGITIDSSNNMTIPGSIYFSSNTSTTTGKPLFAYNSTYTKFGIWYKEGNPDVMAFSASGNGDTTTNADFAIEGGGKLYNKGNIIPYTDSDGSIGGTTTPVYVDGGQIKACTSYANATVGNANKAAAANLTTTQNALAYYTDAAGTFGNASKITVYNDVDITVQSASKKRNGIRLSGTCYGNTATDLTSNTVGVMRYEDGGVRIEFSADSSDNAALLYTNHNSANTGGGSSFHFVGQNGSNNTGGNLAVTAPDFVARRRMAVGYNFTDTNYGLKVNGASLFNGNFEVRGNAIRFRNANNDNNQASTNPWVTSLLIGDGQHVMINEYHDDYLSIKSKGLILNTRSTAIAVYDNTKTYAVGAVVWYNKDYYVCKTAIETAEEWTAGHWTKRDPSGDILVEGDMIPWSNNTYTLGNSSYKWSTVYGTSGVFGTITIGGSADVASKTISSSSTLYLNRATSTSIIFAYNGTNKMRIDTDNAFRPETTNTLSVGTNSYKWASVYATNFYGTFNGNADTATSAGKWTTARTLTIGSTGKTVDGSGNVSWSLAEIGAAASGHEHDYIGNSRYIAYTTDGHYEGSGTVTGYIKIRIPKTKSATMLSFDVDIYNYSGDTSTRYHIAGYNYSDASWNNTTAYCIAPLSNAKANLTVRFLSNGNDEMYVTIGETDTSWSYPKVNVHNIVMGHSGNSLANWASGWTITITNTAFASGQIKVTKTNTNVAYTSITAGTSTLAWNEEKTLYTIGDAVIKAKLPAMPTYSDVGAAPSSTVSCTTANVKSALGTGSDTTKFLNNKGEWTVPPGTYSYSLPLAASGTRGGIQIGYSESGTNYAVKLSSEKAYVSVPWTDTHMNVTLQNTTTSSTYIYFMGFNTAPTSTATAKTGVSSTSMWANAVDKGKFELVLGNSTSTANTGGQFGQLALYSASSAGTYLKAADGTSWTTATLQAKTGTIALTSDIPNCYGKVTVSAQSSAVTALTSQSSATTPAAKSANETLKFTTANKWIVATGTESSTAGSDEIKIAHLVPSSISNTGPSSAQTPGYNATFNIPVISIDEAGHVTGISTTTVKIPASDNTNTATAADDILDGSNSGTQITYAPYSAQQSKLSFDKSTTDPTRTDRLNLNGNFHATNLYGDTTVIDNMVTLKYNSTDSALEFVFA